MKKQNIIKMPVTKPNKKPEQKAVGGCVIIQFPHVPQFDMWCKKDRIGGAA